MICSRTVRFRSSSPAISANRMRSRVGGSARVQHCPCVLPAQPTGARLGGFCLRGAGSCGPCQGRCVRRRLFENQLELRQGSLRIALLQQQLRILGAQLGTEWVGEQGTLAALAGYRHVRFLSDQLLQDARPDPAIDHIGQPGIPNGQCDGGRECLVGESDTDEADGRHRRRAAPTPAPHRVKG